MSKKNKNKKLDEAIDAIMSGEMIKSKKEKEANVSEEIDSQFKASDSDKLDYESNINKTKYVSYNQRLIANILLIVIFSILTIVLLVSSITIKSRSSVLYKQTSNLDYKVYLKENNYYDEPYLNKNMQYIASLIDNIDVSFNYNFNINQNINYTYMYYIKSDVLVMDSKDESKVIYKKSDKLTEPDYFTMDNSNGFSINKDIKIDYSKYNDLVKSFKNSYAISADSNLVLSLCIEIKDEKGNIIKSIDSSDTMKLTIPLTEQMINIGMDYKEVNNSDNIKVYKDFSIQNSILFALSLLSLIILVVVVIRLLLFIRKTTSKKSIYDITLSKILKEYDRVIVNSRKMIDINGAVVDVDSFNELLDVRDNIEKPIIFHEIHKREKSIFIVKTENETYRYTLKLVDLEKDQQTKKD